MNFTSTKACSIFYVVDSRMGFQNDVILKKLHVAEAVNISGVLGIQVHMIPWF